MKKNILFNALSVLVAGFVLFLTYKYAIFKLGVSQLGVWSLIVALASFSKIIENGIAISALRITAQVSDSKGGIEDVLINSLIIGAFGVLIFNIVLYLLISKLTPVFYDENVAALSSILLIPVLIFGWINSISMIFLSILEGLRNIRLKLIVTTMSGLVFLGAMIPAIDTYGLRGLVYAQIIQSISLSLMMYFVFYFYLKVELKISKINFLTIKELIIFSRSTQFITFTHLLSEPTTKILLAYFGGANFVALFDMALKLINQLRSIVVAANQVIVPVVTKMFVDLNQKKIQNYYSVNLKFVYYAGCVIYFPLMILSPEISFYWLGTEDQNFIVFLSILSVVNLLNIFTIPGYYMSISGNEMRWNTLGHLIFCVLNILFGVILGYLINGRGVFWGYISALTITSTVMLLSYNKQYELNWINFLRLLNLRFVVIVTIFIAIILVLNSILKDKTGGVGNFMALKFLIISLGWFFAFLEIKKYKESNFDK